MKILITSVGTATSVNLIRYFKKMGDKVLGTDINEYGMTAGSLLVDKFIKVPLATDPNYIDSIKSIITKENIEVLIPINDIEVYLISKKIDEIECKCLIPTAETINTLRDKFICSSHVKRLGIDVPNIMDEDDSNIHRILRDRIGVGSKGIEYIEPGIKCHEYSREDQFLQECVTGREYTVDVLADKDGKPIYIVPRERLEVKSGVATKVRIVKDQTLIDAVKTIMSEFKLPGFSNIQFIKDQNGKCWFIEVNYRFSGCGAATLATSKQYLEKYKNCLSKSMKESALNEDTQWNAIVTRYYEEVVYEGGIS